VSACFVVFPRASLTCQHRVCMEARCCACSASLALPLTAVLLLPLMCALAPGGNHRRYTNWRATYISLIRHGYTWGGHLPAASSDTYFIKDECRKGASWGCHTKPVSGWLGAKLRQGRRLAAGVCWCDSGSVWPRNRFWEGPDRLLVCVGVTVLQSGPETVFGKGQIGCCVCWCDSGQSAPETVLFWEGPDWLLVCVCV
jgi:hypothetical protein